MIFLGSLVLALVLHIFIGWPWSLFGGAVAGFFSAKIGWLIGAAAVGLSWTILILYNFSVAPAETARFVRITGGLLGNMSGPMLVVVTVLIGVLLGLLGGTIGGLTRRLATEINGRRRP